MISCHYVQFFFPFFNGHLHAVDKHHLRVRGTRTKTLRVSRTRKHVKEGKVRLGKENMKKNRMSEREYYVKGRCIYLRKLAAKNEIGKSLSKT